MDAVICHWVKAVAAIETCTEGLGLSIWYLALYFYADNGLITSTQPERLQWVLNILSGLLDRVGIRTNKQNMVSMACHPCHTHCSMLVVAYDHLTICTGPTFW